MMEVMLSPDSTPARRDREMPTPTYALAVQANTHSPYDAEVVRDRTLPWMGGSYAQVDDIRTVAEALTLGGLDWEVAKRNIRTMDGTLIPDYQAVIRTDTKAPLGVVGTKFQPLQNTQALAPVDAILGESGGTIRAVGPLNGGRRVFVAIELPQAVRVPGDDTTTVHPWMVVANGHDGSLALSVNVLEHVVRCTNILVALASHAAYRIRLVHRPGIEARYHQAHQVVGQVNGYLRESNDLKADLAARRITEGQAKAILQAAFPVPVRDTSAADGGRVGRPTQFDGAWDGLLHSPTIPDPLRLTAWGAVQAVTEYVDHGTAWRGGKRGDVSDRRMNALVFGGRADGQKARAIEAALALPRRRTKVVTVD
jgi:phage/plasmid-like protein (TIGR03299 family)